ncbi:helix-turn-helix domain-containing protein [Actinoallomurus sp. NBC_01490]|uniref:helix-turn-helix domain-containing protein n=1 Tax=Actinoallomurus sp. NBC_01490 TaxID=2903557 RepID=UPI002E3439E4|nr:helix-turn-helix domain-containing protein [Actinoallomurus sp. NBC_01490]
MPGSMRDRILAAAVSVMRERGVAHTTTKEIARVAGVAEGSIYNHFADKAELVAASMTEMAGGIRDALTRLSQRVGQNSVEDNLAEFAEAQILFFTDLLPITGPVLGDHDLRAWLRAGGPQTSHGEPAPAPVLGHAAVIAYLEAERDVGRLAAWARPPCLAALLIGACRQYAFVRLLTPPETITEVAGLPADPAEYARDVAHTVMAGHHARRARPR